MKYAIAVSLAVVAAVAGYFGLRRLTHVACISRHSCVLTCPWLRPRMPAKVGPLT